MTAEQTRALRHVMLRDLDILHPLSEGEPAPLESMESWLRLHDAGLVVSSGLTSHGRVALLAMKLAMGT